MGMLYFLIKICCMMLSSLSYNLSYYIILIHIPPSPLLYTLDELPNQGMMWGAISKADQFYAKLPWTVDGKVLWNELKKNNQTTNLDVLTGVPRHNKSRAEKFAWCKRELGIEANHVDMAGKKSAHELVTGRRKDKEGIVNVITCWSKNKHCESKANHILIDDRLALREKWEQRGGIFIHHTSAERSIKLLRERGVLLIDREAKESLLEPGKSETGKSEEN